MQLRQLSSLTQIASVRAFRSAPAHERATSQQYPEAHFALAFQAQKPLRKPLSLVHAIHQQPLIAPQHSTAGSSDTETIAAVVTGEAASHSCSFMLSDGYMYQHQCMHSCLVAQVRSKDQWPSSDCLVLMLSRLHQQCSSPAVTSQDGRPKPTAFIMAMF